MTLTLEKTPVAYAYPALAVGCRVRLIVAEAGRWYVLDGTGTVTRAVCDERGRMGFGVTWDSGRDVHVADASWLVPDDVPRDADGYLAVPAPDRALADFRASLARYGCAWTGDTREPAAWHAEQPERSGWWEARGKVPVFSLTVRSLMEAGDQCSPGAFVPHKPKEG